MVRRETRSKWFRFVACGALAALVLVPAVATEETAKAAEKDKPAEKAASAQADAEKKPASTEAGKPAGQDAAECKPGAARVNTLEDMFGIANWTTLQARTAKPVGPATQVAWRDATADARKDDAPKAE